MDTKRKLGLILLIIITGIFYWTYTGNFLDNSSNLEEFIVERVIDGDTIALNNGPKVRLKGINTPEQKMPLNTEAKNFLQNLIINKSILLDRHGTDRYSRVLGYILLDGVNINRELLSRGMGNLYYYDKDDYYKSMQDAELSARENELGIWAPSENHECLTIDEFTWFDETDSDSEKLILKNRCESLNIIIKDDATHIYEREIKDQITLNTKDIWNDDGDSLYIWDDTGLILFERY